MNVQIKPGFPKTQTAGVDGFLISFGDKLTEPANRAALAFRAALETAAWEGVEETCSTLVSTFVRFSPVYVSHADLQARLQSLLASQDWYQAAPPNGRRVWRVPTVFGTELAPQLDAAAAAAGMTEEEAIASLSGTLVRVQTVGFAPGQPYLGELPQAWDIPRQSKLTERVPQGALAVAIRQMVLFSVAAPTGWMHVGQTAIQTFRPEAEDPFLLRPGDEVQFTPTDPAQLHAMRADPKGGASCEVIR